jgi:Ca-activated chloride channel family protein
MGLDALHRALVGAALSAAAAGPAGACAVALALAIDVSGSVDPGEYRLQTQGLARALADPTVTDALVAARAMVMVVQWSGRSRQAVVVPWRQMTDVAAVAALAAEAAEAERHWWLFSTGIGEALVFTASAFDGTEGCARRVIDVSGDGRSNEGIPPEEVRGALVRQGFTVNGLAIEGSEPDVAAYYREHVIAGPGAFVFVARDFEDYPETMRRKLITELGDPLSAAPARVLPAGLE